MRSIRHLNIEFILWQRHLIRQWRRRRLIRQRRGCLIRQRWRLLQTGSHLISNSSIADLACVAEVAAAQTQVTADMSGVHAEH